MEDFIFKPHNIYDSQGNLGNSLNDKPKDVTLEKHEKYYFGDSLLSYFLHRLFTTTLKNIKMAEAKVAWILWHILGGSSFLLSILPSKYLGLLDINMAAVPQPFQAILWGIAVLYGLTLLWRSFHKGYHMHLRNRHYRQQIQEHKQKLNREKV